MRSLSESERNRIKILTKYSIPFTLLQPTQTGLNKNIMDATASVRLFFKEQKIHDYDTQKAGPSYKEVIENTFFISFSLLVPSRTSMYRPEAKQKGGDPRIWFRGLPQYAKPDDLLTIIYLDDCLYVLNITQLPVEQMLLTSLISPLKELIEEFEKRNTSISEELLQKIKVIVQQGPLKAIKSGDTAIGHALETALCIRQNNSKKPDYKGIELKSYRAKKSLSQENRKTLFAQVPNWELSKLKSSREILGEFGYKRGDDFKLYCTLSSLTRNSQGLMLRLDSDISKLIENSDKKEIGDFGIWLMSDLKKRLLEKHNETFWIAADTTKVSNIEYFKYKKILHTKKPLSSAFDILLEQGEITLDHLIKRDCTGKVNEKGPLFKISHSAFELLFPEQKEYIL